MLDEIYQKYADEQAFLRKPFPLFCVQVAYWIFFQPNLLVYYRTLSADLRRRDVSDYPEIILKALFLDGSYNSYLITHTTGYRLQRAVDCILMTVIMLFIMIPFLVVMIGLLPYFSHISPIVMIIFIILVWLWGCSIAPANNPIGFVPIFSASVVAMIVLVMCITLNIDPLGNLDAPSRGLFELLMVYARLFLMLVLCAGCGFITLSMSLVAEFCVNHIIQMGKWSLITTTLLCGLVFLYGLLIYTYVLLTA